VELLSTAIYNRPDHDGNHTMRRETKFRSTKAPIKSDFVKFNLHKSEQSENTLSDQIPLIQLCTGSMHQDRKIISKFFSTLSIRALGL